MKCTVSAKDLKTALKSINAVLGYGGTNTNDNPCLLTVTETGLVLETARNGASVERTIECKVLREGTAGVSSTPLTDMKVSGEVLLEATKTHLIAKAGKAKHEISLHSQAAQIITEQRIAVDGIESKAKIPVSMLKSAAKCCIYKSDVKADFDCQIIVKTGLFEFAGIDNISCGRFKAENDTIKAKAPFNFVLPTDLFSKLVDEIDGDACEIQHVPQQGVIVLVGKNFNIVHPTIEKATVDIQERLNEIEKMAKNAKITVRHSDVKEGLETVAAAAKLKNTVVIGIKPGKAILMAQNETTDARQVLVPEAVEVDGDVKMTAKYSYLNEIIKVSPSSANLELTLYDNKFIHIHVVAEPSNIDYVVMQIT